MHFKTFRKSEYAHGWVLFDDTVKIAISVKEYKTDMECLQAIWDLQKSIPNAEIQDSGHW